MKKYQGLDLPDGPADVEALWRKAEPLERSILPAWLTPEAAGSYRYLGEVSVAHLPLLEQAQCWAELQRMATCGIICERGPGRLLTHRLYIQSPRYPQVWSIGVCSGKSPWELGAAQDFRNPVLTRDDVVDVTAVFVADPFMVKVGPTWYMFFEVMNWRSDKGEIGMAVSQNARDWTYNRIVLSEPFHLSYPYVFSWADDFYMVPESFQAGSVRLYRATKFPTEWKFVGSMLQAPYVVDASVFRFEERWWLFAETSPARRHDTLRLYYADELLGPWTEHSRSPIIAGNARLARPAGRVLVVGGRLIRYAQNCSQDYGVDVRAIEVTKLSPTRYSERELITSPILRAGGFGWNAHGMHHIDPHRSEGGGWVACVDGWYGVDAEHERSANESGGR